MNEFPLFGYIAHGSEINDLEDIVLSIPIPIDERIKPDFSNVDFRSRDGSIRYESYFHSSEMSKECIFANFDVEFPLIKKNEEIEVWAWITE
jgi:hypothetical protein